MSTRFDRYPQGYAQEFASPGFAFAQRDIREELAGLIEHFAQYDALRLKLQKKGGELRDLERLTQHINKNVSIGERYYQRDVTLRDPVELQRAIGELQCDLHLDVRKLPSRMPVYLFCRTREDYWGEYSLIVEDLYLSPGYPVNDERFVKLMQWGHEVYYLRLSQFREGAAGIVRSAGGADAMKLDDLLYDLGRHVFQAAWHEDQRMGFLAADNLGLPNFKQAIELLYLCLGGELCELRSVTDKRVLAFFQRVYVQPALHAFMQRLDMMDGEMLNLIARRAEKLYRLLLKEFSIFLTLEVAWGEREYPTPLWKILYGNFPRLELVGNCLRGNTRLQEGIVRLEGESRAVIHDLTA